MKKNEKIDIEKEIKETREKIKRIEEKTGKISDKIWEMMKLIFKKHFSGSFTINYIGESDDGLLLITHLYDYFNITIEYKDGMIRTYVDSGEKIDIEITQLVRYDEDGLYDFFKKVEKELLLRMEDKYIEKYGYNNGGDKL